MKHPITAETLFEEFVEQIETAVDVVATQVPYTRQQIVSIAFTSVENAGIYYDGVKECRRKDTADKTWDAIKKVFERSVSYLGHQRMKDTERTARELDMPMSW